MATKIRLQIDPVDKILMKEIWIRTEKDSVFLLIK